MLADRFWLVDKQTTTSARFNGIPFVRANAKGIRLKRALVIVYLSTGSLQLLN